ncbi:hypothetical protein BC940DRAFT_287811 [Gongronella butleri]|nr:hypothetical protein BC940DRAFT_287811 [Gongronella butleri]
MFAGSNDGNNKNTPLDALCNSGSTTGRQMGDVPSHGAIARRAAIVQDGDNTDGGSHDMPTRNAAEMGATREREVEKSGARPINSAAGRTCTASDGIAHQQHLNKMAFGGQNQDNEKKGCAWQGDTQPYDPDDPGDSLDEEENETIVDDRIMHRAQKDTFTPNGDFSAYFRVNVNSANVNANAYNHCQAVSAIDDGHLFDIDFDEEDDTPAHKDDLYSPYSLYNQEQLEQQRSGPSPPNKTDAIFNGIGRTTLARANIPKDRHAIKNNLVQPSAKHDKFTLNQQDAISLSSSSLDLHLHHLHDASDNDQDNEHADSPISPIECSNSSAIGKSTSVEQSPNRPVPFPLHSGRDTSSSPLLQQCHRRQVRSSKSVQDDRVKDTLQFGLDAFFLHVTPASDHGNERAKRFKATSSSAPAAPQDGWMRLSQEPQQQRIQAAKSTANAIAAANAALHSSRTSPNDKKQAHAGTSLLPVPATRQRFPRLGLSKRQILASARAQPLARTDKITKTNADRKTLGMTRRYVRAKQP